MKISNLERNAFIDEIKKLNENGQLFEMSNYIQHGNTTTLTHSLAVAYYSYLLALRLPLRFDAVSVIRGAMLHDYYLYDWHTPDISHKLHGFTHPKTALDNARKHYSLNAVEEDIIVKHMWPLTLTKAPLCREAMLVCLVDKYISSAETFYIPILPRELKQLRLLMSGGGLVY